MNSGKIEAQISSSVMLGTTKSNADKVCSIRQLDICIAFFFFLRRFHRERALDLYLTIFNPRLGNLHATYVDIMHYHWTYSLVINAF